MPFPANHRMAARAPLRPLPLLTPTEGGKSETLQLGGSFKILRAFILMVCGGFGTGRIPLIDG